MRLAVIKVVFGQQALVCLFPKKQVSLTAPIYKADEPPPTVQREDRLTAPCSTFAPHVLFSVPALCRLRVSLRMPSKTPDTTLTSLLLHASMHTASAIMSPCSPVNTLGMSPTASVPVHTGMEPFVYQHHQTHSRTSCKAFLEYPPF